MKTKLINGVEVHESSGNVFADLGLPDPEKHMIKAQLVDAIIDAMRQFDLTQAQAAEQMGLTQPKVSEMIRGHFTGISERKLMDCLNRLGYDIEIRLTAPRKPSAAAKRLGSMQRSGNLAVAYAS
jgi:predicted XRE-type DNA-binding protein